MDLKTKLEDLGYTLPPAPEPVAAYVPWRQDDSGLISVSGQLPLCDGALLATGPVACEAADGEVSLEQAQQAARQCVLNGLAIIDQAIGNDWTRFSHVVRLGVFVCSRADFTQQHLVANGASAFLQAVLGKSGRHARAAVGVIALPLGAAVEVELAVQCARPTR